MTEIHHPFLTSPEEYEEYRAVMDAMADEAETSAPDPLPIHLGSKDFVSAFEIVPAGFSTVRSVRL